VINPKAPRPDSPDVHRRYCVVAASCFRKLHCPLLERNRWVAIVTLYLSSTLIWSNFIGPAPTLLIPSIDSPLTKSVCGESKRRRTFFPGSNERAREAKRSAMRLPLFPLQHPLTESLACCLRQIRKNLIEEETYMKNRLHTVTSEDGEWAKPEDMASQGLDAILAMRHAICFKLFFHGVQQQ
jgi:hypothetical protein